MHDPNFPPNLAIQPSGLASTDGCLNFDQETGIKKYGIAGRVWEAAYTLSTYTTVVDAPMLEFDPPCSLFHNQSKSITVIEVGSGTGYAGVHVAHQLDAFYRQRNNRIEIILTDLENVIPLLKEGIQEHLGGVGTNVQVRALALAWGHFGHAHALAEEVRKLERPVTHVLCSDLVYFPHLYAPLLRTLLTLTSTPFCGISSTPEVIIGYKVRSLTKEAPFWQVFGTWFRFEAVLVKESSEREGEDVWARFGQKTDTHVFVATRRPESFQWEVPLQDSQLMNGFGPSRPTLDDTFESIIMLGINE